MLSTVVVMTNKERRRIVKNLNKLDVYLRRLLKTNRIYLDRYLKMRLSYLKEKLNANIS